MCGIAGFLDKKNNSSIDNVELSIAKMTDALIHRGPDDTGYWIDKDKGAALGHRRLSILDLSLSGHQPMHSQSGRFVVVFNGEIYNYKEIRKELERKSSYKWCGHSDTEVLLAAIESWGLSTALQKTVGMFAVAVWDRSSSTLSLARDRVGEKPLYYGWNSEIFMFASELKALRAYPGFKTEINREALALFLRYSYIPAPNTIYKDIYKLLPGSIVKIGIGDKSVVLKSYWTAAKIAEDGITHPFPGCEAEAVERLDNLLRDAIAKQMVADVPLGAFLSGGIDSSTIVALMQAQSSRAVKTFTIGFNEGGYNEALHAKAVAGYLGTDHTELYVTSEEAMAVIPKLPHLYDEPFSDVSQIPTFLISQLARQDVTVSLSGDAGDELFGGYNRYFWSRNIWNKIGWMPKSLRSTLSYTIQLISPKLWDQGFKKMNFVLPYKIRQNNPGDKLHKMSKILNASNPEEIYRGLVTHWEETEDLVNEGHEPLSTLSDSNKWVKLPDSTQRMMYLDLVTYLPDDILVKVDRAAMGVSLESRIPFLDHRVVEFAWQVPLSMKIRNGQTKWLIRQLLYKYVPQELIERPKMGFAVPIDFWLRGPLKEWAESLLDKKRIIEEGFFNPTPIREKWEEHLSGRRNWQNHLWSILMFQAWLEHWN